MITHDDIRKIVVRHLSRRKSILSIAAHLEVPSSTLRGWMRKWGLRATFNCEDRSNQCRKNNHKAALNHGVSNPVVIRYQRQRVQALFDGWSGVTSSADVRVLEALERRPDQSTLELSIMLGYKSCHRGLRHILRRLQRQGFIDVKNGRRLDTPGGVRYIYRLSESTRQSRLAFAKGDEE